MPKLRMKAWKDIKRLPVWTTRGKALVLTWQPKFSVITMLPQCPRCSIWHSPTASTAGGSCRACAENPQAVDAATYDILEVLTEVVADDA